MRKKPGFLAVVPLFIIFACSENTPQIVDMEWQVIMFQNRLLDAVYPKLSVFVRGTDKDGQNDLQALHIINDDAELYWTISSDQWETATIQGNDWFGSNGLVASDPAALAIGTYRVVLEDLSGKRVETQFYLKRENLDVKNVEYPSVVVTESMITAGGNFVDPELWVFDTNDQFQLRIPMTQKQITFDAIVSKNKALESGFSFYIYGKKSGFYYGVMAGPYYYTK